MRFPVQSFLVFSCLYLGSSPSLAQMPTATEDITEISVCTQEWENSTNADMTGLYWDTFKAVFEPVGVELKVTFMPYKISIARARAKECDIAMGGYMNEYSDLLYAKWPHEVEAVIAVHATDTEFRDESSFIGKKTAWLKDYGFQRFLPAGIDYTEVRSETLGLRMLERARVDFFVDYEPHIENAAAVLGIDLGNYTLSPVAVLSKMVYPMFRHDDRGTALVDLYSRRMAELHQDGTLNLIFGKYQEGLYPAPAVD